MNKKQKEAKEFIETMNDMSKVGKLPIESDELEAIQQILHIGLKGNLLDKLLKTNPKLVDEILKIKKTFLEATKIENN